MVAAMRKSMVRDVFRAALVRVIRLLGDLREDGESEPVGDQAFVALHRRVNSPRALCS
jgi:hypothetical protein